MNTSRVTERDNLLPDIPSRGSAEETPTPLEDFVIRPSKFFPPQDPDRYHSADFPRWMEKARKIKPVELEFPPTPRTDPDSAERDMEIAAYRRFLGIPTPTGEHSITQAEMEEMVRKDELRKTDLSNVPQELLDRTMSSDKERSGVKQGKKRESPDLNDKAGDSSIANGKQREREVSNERNTLYYGGRQNEETGLLTDVDPVLLSQSYDNDPRFVSRHFHLP